jgi:hypothetical protein
MGELLELILGFIIEVFGEALLQFIFEFLAELGLRSMTGHTVSDGKPGRVLSFIGCALFGVVAGAISYALFPHSMIHKASFRLTNVIVTPLVAGALMAWLGSWHNKHGRRVVGLDKFLNGWVFALVFALIRYKWCW